MEILVYQDYVHNSGALFETLCGFAGRQSVRYVNADDILNGCLTSDVSAFVMPGGASRYVADKLNGRGNEMIREYVSDGGLYVGICAGAYYACSRTEWAPKQGDVFLIDNELAFFSGTAHGPIGHFTHEELGLSFTIDSVVLEKEDGKKVPALYWGGPVFLNKGNADCEVLARYADLPDKPAAIITGKVAQGRYLLISPHLEIDSKRLELMRFNVVSNILKDVNLLASPHHFTHDYFGQLIEKYVTRKS